MTGKTQSTVRRRPNHIREHREDDALSSGPFVERLPPSDLLCVPRHKGVHSRRRSRSRRRSCKSVRIAYKHQKLFEHPSFAASVTRLFLLHPPTEHHWTGLQHSLLAHNATEVSTRSAPFHGMPFTTSRHNLRPTDAKSAVHPPTEKSSRSGRRDVTTWNKWGASRTSYYESSASPSCTPHA